MSWRRKPVARNPVPQQRLRALIDMRAWEAAIDEARRVIVHEPDNASAYAYMAQAFLKLERHDEGLQAAEAAIRLDPAREWHFRLRSLALTGLDRHEEALRSAEEAARLSPEEPKAQFVLGNCQARCRLWVELLETARRYEHLAPDREPPHHLRGEALWGMGDVEGARAAYDRALSLDPTCPQLHAHVGRLLLQEGRTKDAVASFLQGLRLNPKVKGLEAGLLYAVRRRLDVASASPPNAARACASASPQWKLAMQLHVLALRKPSGYRFWFRSDPPSLEYRSPLSSEDAEEVAAALRAWRRGGRDEGIRVLIEMGLPAHLAEDLAEGKTARYPAGIGLDDMMRHWMLTVLDLERGYPRDAGDYEHDCAVRDAIDAIMERVSPDLRAKIEQTLAPWDARFDACRAAPPAQA